ncbi:hypothetical protein DPMN_012654 [Dreissena polymorpha]|uniref:Uncharacterized protein n=1 Tax=Dreissena polymorpha TaxID=45954 RepID=A0A9D4S2Y2_DREPO|nr:hypothetical protein DPMN_012654 [Dreissena polymorpha]
MKTYLAVKFSFSAQNIPKKESTLETLLPQDQVHLKEGTRQVIQIMVMITLMMMVVSMATMRTTVSDVRHVSYNRA